MKLSDVVNVIDLEHDNGQLIEIGITTVDLIQDKILKSVSLPIISHKRISQEIFDLTGWTQAKLTKQGVDKEEAIRRLIEKYGFKNRLLISDTSDEIEFLEHELKHFKFSPHRLNVAVLFKLLTGQDTNIGLDGMLGYFGAEFEGKKHSARDDSYNIARLFILLKGLATW